MIRVNLLKNLKAHSQLPSHVQVLDLLTDKVQVPNEETTYWCKVFKLPESFRRKHHIYQYEANIESTSQGLVHHMEIFHCETSAMEKIPLYNGNCFGEDRPEKTQVCKRVLAAWAMGAQPFTYPEEAALPLGGNKFNPYVMLEIHYNNPELKSGVIDSSGVRFYVSDMLKEMDAGVIELGLEYTDKMAIPPGQESFSLTGYCISSCTSVGLHNEGITVFGSQLHTHLTGVRVHTRHFDAYGKELPELDRDNHYSTHFQEIRRLKRPVKVLPRDFPEIEPTITVKLRLTVAEERKLPSCLVIKELAFENSSAEMASCQKCQKFPNSFPRNPSMDFPEIEPTITVKLRLNVAEERKLTSCLVIEE
ncbi:hypothetical protein YQE_00915, partial [Dendroctonus ponderosae]